MVVTGAIQIVRLAGLTLRPSKGGGRWFNLLMLLPALVLLGLLVVYPLCYSVWISLQSQAGNLTLANYLSLLGDPVFYAALRNTIVFTAVAVGLEFLIGLGLAFALQNVRLQVRTLVRSVLLLPLMIAPVVAALEWRWLFNDQYGLIGYLASLVDLRAPLWLADPKVAMWSVVAVDVWIATPFVMLVSNAALHTLPQEPYEAVTLDGASWQLFRYLTLPFLRPAILVILLIRAIDALRVFDIVFVLTKGGPGYSTETLTMYAYRLSFSFQEFGKGAALSFLLLILIGLVGAALIRLVGRSSRPQT
jgi:multiple sugar transport system permease protein